MAVITGTISRLIPLAFLPSGGQWVVIALMGVMLFAKRLLPQVAKYRQELQELGDSNPRAAIHRFGVLLTFWLFGIGCWVGIVQLGSGQSASDGISFLAAGFALGLALMLTRKSGPD